MTATPALVDLSVDHALEQIEDAFARGAHVQVTGPVGSGKTMLAGALGRRHGAVVVEPPDLSETDAVAHALLQAARSADVEIDGRRSTEENVRAIGRRLAGDGRAVVLRLAASWWLNRRPRFDHEGRLLSAARAFVQTWFDCAPLGVVLIVDSPDGMPACGRRIGLEPSRARAEMLEDDNIWGAYAGAARGLLEAMGAVWSRPSAVVLRLAVGLVALGETPQAVAGRVFRNVPPGDLVGALVQRTRDRGLVAPLLRFARIVASCEPHQRRARGRGLHRDR